VNDAFKELEVAGWREPGRGDAYDAIVGRVTARPRRRVSGPKESTVVECPVVEPHPVLA
jgi:hypothetical protein